MNEFNFDGLLNALGKNITEFAAETGIAPNTCTTWRRLKTDARIRQESVYKIIKAYPDRDLSEFMPMYRELHEQYRKNITK